MKQNAFLDDEAVLRSCGCLPPFLLVEFVDWLELANKVLFEAQKPAEELYANDPFFQQVCDRLLRFNGLNPEQINIPLMNRLLFDPGLLVALNKPKEGGSKGGGSKVSLERWLYSLIAALLEVEGGVVRAIEACRSIPADLLEGVLEARAEQYKQMAKSGSQFKLTDEQMAELKDMNFQSLVKPAAATNGN